MAKKSKSVALKPKSKASGQSDGPSLKNVTHVKGVNFYRDAKKVRQVNMLKGGKATRDKNGNIIKEAEFQSRLPSGTQARVQPDRRWFENTRTIGQNALNAFREAIGRHQNDPYSFVMAQSKLPMSLIAQSEKTAKVQMLQADSFANTFGPGAQRKRPKLKSASVNDMANDAHVSIEKYSIETDGGHAANKQTDGAVDTAPDPFLRAGQSRRIWNELYKVLDSSDVVIHVLDARDPLGTRCRNVEKYLREEAKHKHLIFVLNKCDLVPTWVTSRWVKVLSKEHPTLAFHASINNSFGKGSLIQLLRQFSKLHADKKQISVGFFGYPNTGKSSIINTLRQKKVCNVAPVPGETKVWQYITLMRRIYLIDCPGVVHPSAGDSETDIVLRGVVRIENLDMPEQHIPAVLERVRPEYIRRTYGIREWSDSTDFLSQVAHSAGKLLKGAEPDLNTAAKMVLNDWLRGKIPYYVDPPAAEGDEMDDVSATQQLDEIPVNANFLPEDATEDALRIGVDRLTATTKAGESDSEPALEWEDVCEPGDDAAMDSSLGAPPQFPVEQDVSDQSDSDSESETDDSEVESKSATPTEKAPRMTTSKRKVGIHFYETANVKNRRRKAQKQLNPKAILKRLQGKGTRRN
ncbi:NUC091 domain-containing protein [Phlyctochytrium arcticum]|nr:NUC091 domain-containing protein [Phlyctochytrium arcticum]